MKARNGRIVAALGAAGLLVALWGGGVASAQQATSATTELHDRNGASVGVAVLTQTADGVLVSAQLRGLPPGVHGIHIHAAGRCEGPDFTTAGGHFNPTNKEHGINNPNGPHIGDLYGQTEPPLGSNARVGADGAASFRGLARGATVAAGPTGLLGGPGTSLMVHAMQDDNMTDPTGMSGDRLACGVIVAGVQALPRTGAALGGADSGPAGGATLAGAGALLAVLGAALHRRGRLPARWGGRQGSGGAPAAGGGRRAGRHPAG